MRVDLSYQIFYKVIIIKTLRYWLRQVKQNSFKNPSIKGNLIYDKGDISTQWESSIYLLNAAYIAGYASRRKQRFPALAIHQNILNELRFG